MKTTATIAPTDFGTFGIWWEGMPYPYSGPFNTREAARARAVEIAEYRGDSLLIVNADINPDILPARTPTPEED